jgi:glutathione S-transferase
MLGELGLDYDHEEYLPRAPETRTPEFRELNPNGRVPVIDDDGFVLAESMAINLYLAKNHKSPLYPSDPRDEALVWQWSLWETDRLDRHMCSVEGSSPCTTRVQAASRGVASRRIAAGGNWRRRPK